MLLLVSPTLCYGRQYEITPKWLTTENDFRTAQVSDKNVLTDSYSRFDSDTFNIVDIEATGDYALNISLDITNLHGKNYLNYPAYGYDAKGKKKKMGSTRNPIYGWVIGMKDREHYNAVWLRSAAYDDVLYEESGINYCVVTVNGNDTTYHVEWTSCRQESYTMNEGSFPLWMEYSNGTLMVGGGWLVSTPWSIVHGIKTYGNYTGLYLGSAASVKVENLFIAVNDKETLPPTAWNTANLQEYYTNNDLNVIEGFWQQSFKQVLRTNIKMGGNYTLGIVHNEDVYDIIYLSGATIYPGKWQEGSVKGRVKANQAGYYEGVWYDAEGEKLDNIQLFITRDNFMQINFRDENTILYFARSGDIETPELENYTIYGTGFMIDANGYIATNHHVIDDAKNISLTNNYGQSEVKYRAEVVISDSINDLAILRITDEMIPCESTPYGLTSRKARLGEEIYYMGYPKPFLLNSGIKTSTGTITADNGYYASQYMVSIDIDGGSSGSPVFDKEGNVIGVISGGYTKSTTIITANFAIKSQYLIDLINKANRRLEHPITYQTTSKIKELPHTDKLDAIAPYVFIIKVEY